MPTVFVTNDSGHDYHDAERFGELVVMSEGLIDKFNVTSMLRTFRKFLRTSTADDFILVSGPGVMNAVACAAFAAQHGCLNILLWRFEKTGEDRYVHHRIILNKEIQGDKSCRSDS